METGDNIQVIVRVRPLNPRESLENQKSCLRYSEENTQTLILDCKPDPKIFYFDLIANEKMSQLEIFQQIGKPISVSALEGYNVCLFAYGQTGAGKTYTMQGNLESLEEKGLQPRIFDQIFMMINKMKKDSAEFLVKCSYIEVYNEQIMDLVFLIILIKKL